jgi:tetratricopeptide (TPR) repeat protein
MEGLIFIIAAAAIGYFVYNSLPETKFTKANEILATGNLELALQKLYEIKEKHKQAGVRIAEIKFQIAESLVKKRNTAEALVELQAVLDVQKSITLSTINRSDFIGIETKATKVIHNIHYQKAVDLFVQGQPNLALSNLENLKNKHNKAWVKIAEIRLYIAIQASKSNQPDGDVLLLFSNVIEVQKGVVSSFKDSVNNKEFHQLEQKAREGITTIHYEKGQYFLSENQLDSATNSFDVALKWCSDEMPSTKANCTSALIKIDYKKGKINEQKGSIKNAIIDYERALRYFHNFPKDLFFHDINARIEICKLKENITPLKRFLTHLASQNISSKNELMFRYAFHLAKKNKIEACEKILDDYFITNNAAEIAQLRTFCKKYYQQKALVKIDLVNKIVFA